MPLTGEARKEYQREYMRRRRALTKNTVQAIRQAVDPQRGRPATITEEAAKVSQHVLNMTLESAGLTLTRIVGKVTDKLEATRYFNGKEETIIGQDNDAQLRAAELAIRLHERAGTIPTVNDNGNLGGNGVAIHFHVHRGDFTRADQTIDGQVIESKAIGE